MLNHRLHRLATSLVLTLALLTTSYACSSMRPATSPADVVLRVAAAVVAPGDSVQLVLENESAGTIGYNLCTSTLERRSGETWQPVPSDRVCTMELRTLEPGQDARFTLPLPAALTPGEYRAVTGVERMESGDRVGVASEPFTVQ